MSSKAASESPAASDYASAVTNDDVAAAASSTSPTTVAPPTAAVAPTRHVEPPRILTGFWKLPKALQHRILSLACTSDRLCHYRVVGRSRDCTKTMLRLSLSCKEFYYVVTPLLYAFVRLPAPSALRDFQQALATRPALGSFVKVLHVGPDEALPDYWWPIRKWPSSKGDDPSFRVNLTKVIDDLRRPNWACPSHDLHMDVCTKEEWSLSKAISDALQAASRHLDVSLHQANKSYSGQEIGSDAWHVRVMEVQAAMELWCFETKRSDEEEKRRTGETEYYKLKTKYPRLVVLEGGESSSEGQGGSTNTLLVSRHQIYERMAREGAPTDHFNHPLLYARSGMGWIAESPNDIEHRDEAPREDSGHQENPSDLFACPRRGSSSSGVDLLGSNSGHPRNLSEPLDPAIPSTASIGGNLGLARSVLSLTPHLTSLSLTGFLEWAVVGQRAPPAFEGLKSLTIGPPPNGCSFVHRYEHQTLRSLEKLRICGQTPTPRDIATIVGDDAFPNLKELEWSVVNRVIDGDPKSLMCVIEQLIRFNEETAPNVDEIEKAGQRLKRSRVACEATGGSTSVKNNDPKQQAEPTRQQQQRKSLHITICLHPDDAQKVLDSASTEAVAKAWCTGKAVPGQRHRLQVYGQRKDTRCFGLTWPINDEMRNLFEDGRDFWEEEADCK